MGEVWSEVPSALHKSQDWNKVTFLQFIAFPIADDGISSNPPAQQLNSATLRSKYDFQPVTKVSTPQSAPRPKFKPS